MSICGFRAHFSPLNNTPWSGWTRLCIHHLLKDAWLPRLWPLRRKLPQTSVCRSLCGREWSASLGRGREPDCRTEWLQHVWSCRKLLTDFRVSMVPRLRRRLPAAPPPPGRWSRCSGLWAVAALRCAVHPVPKCRHLRTNSVRRLLTCLCVSFRRCLLALLPIFIIRLCVFLRCV